MQYYIKKIEALTKGTELEGLAKSIIEDIFFKFNQLKEVEKELSKIKPIEITPYESDKEFLKMLIAENKEDIEILTYWMKENTSKAIQDREFYEKYYAPVKECLELSTDRQNKLQLILTKD